VAISWPISINLIVACRTNFTTFGQFIVVAKVFFLKFPAVFGLWQIDWKIFMGRVRVSTSVTKQICTVLLSKLVYQKRE